MAGDRTVLKRLRVRYNPDTPLTYTEFQAVGVGRTVVTATRRAGSKVTTLRMKLTRFGGHPELGR
ncbi:MAG: hypothetical protein ABI807_04010 [Sporichthyaceae bacterium]